MNIVEQGRGTPLVFIPGSQGRWEYARITIEALARHFRVLTFSLADEPTAAFPPSGLDGFDHYAAQVRQALDAKGCDRAVICGLSFGGLVALRFAALHPNRVSALVLASTPGPGWHLKRRHEIYARLPWILGPLFLAEAPFRAGPELVAALPRLRDRFRFARTMGRTFLGTGLSLGRMAARARLIASCDAAADCARVGAPTLVLTGEAGLDYVVRVDGSSQYVRLIGGAKAVVLERTGHQGSLTRPGEFARIVRDFVDQQRHAAA